MCVRDICNIYSFHRAEKEPDPTKFTKNATTLEASVCQLKLPEVRLPQHFDHSGFCNTWLNACMLYIIRLLTSPPRVPLQDAGGFYNIDNEEYDAMPVEVRLLPRKLRFFINAERREQLLAQTQWGGTLTLGGVEALEQSKRNNNNPSPSLSVCMKTT